MAVDKSAAIFDIMTCRLSVVVGLYPRCMGKSLFLGLLEDFLGVVSDTPYSERRARYEKYDIYQESTRFFNNNIGRSPVFKLDLKDQRPSTRDEAASQLHMAVMACCRLHIRFLQRLIAEDDDVDVGAHNIADVRKRLHVHRVEIRAAIKKLTKLRDCKGLTANSVSEICDVIPSLMMVFYWLFERNSVVIVDECDAPFINILCGVNDRGVRAQLFGDYNGLLSKCLKGNSYLRKGVLVGVFDTRYASMGSAPNKAKTFLAHSGVANSVKTPFERAFGFTGHDVWGIVSRYVRECWPARDRCTDVAQFKVRVFTGLLVQCDGYRIGTEPRIFCPPAVMRFLTQLDSVSTPEYLPFNNFRFWSETGRLKMIWPIKPDSLDDLQRYLGHLAAASHWQRRVQETSHMVTQPPETNSPDSEAATQIASQPLEQNELGYRGDLEEQLAKMCMIDRATLIDDLEAGDQVTAKTVIQLMYQAGYLAPISKDQMAIPSKGVLDDIEGFYKHMMQTHSVRF